MGNLSRLLGGGGPLGFQTLLAGDHEVGETSDVFGHPGSGQLQDPVGDGIDEVAVVAHEQEPTGPAGQLLFEPGDAVDVEVVGGLVHHQQVRCRQQEPRQRHPHTPSAGHFVHGSVVILRVEAEAGQDAVGLGLDGVAADLFEPGLGLPVVGKDLFLFRSDS